MQAFLAFFDRFGCDGADRTGELGTSTARTKASSSASDMAASAISETELAARLSIRLVMFVIEGVVGWERRVMGVPSYGSA